jgi:AraC-like DNA-binding protein
MEEVQAAKSFVSPDVESSRLFFLDLVDSEEFSVVFGGFERCAADYKIDRRDFPWYSLEFVSHGEGVLQIGEAEEKLRPGSFFVYGPSQFHRIESAKTNPLGKYFVGFTGPGVGSFLESFKMEPGTISHCPQGESIRRLFDTLIDRGIRKSGLARPLCATITRQLLLMCRDDAMEPGNTEGAAFAAYSRAKDYIERNHLESNTLNGIAEACGIDAPYLCRLFSKHHNESPYRYFTRLRMEHALRLLLESGSSVKSVAAALGFKDAFHFSRVFKSVHHVPPSRFRQTMNPRWIHRKQVDEIP